MKLLTVLIFAAIATQVSGQKKNAEEFYLWDANYKPVQNQKAAMFFTTIVKLNDSCWQWDTYNMTGPLVSSEQYRDHDGTKMNGRYFKYHKNGYLDSAGRVVDGVLDGHWAHFDDSGKVILQKKYVLGRLVETRDLLKESKEDKKKEADTITRDEKESEFKGGISAWIRYLNKNMRYPERAVNLQQTGTVVVQFVVNTTGAIQDIELFRSVEYSIDREALRIIKESPPWTPATQDGRVVRSYKRQPITFRMR